MRLAIALARDRAGDCEQLMKETIRQHKKRCTVCNKEYSEEDNYCGDDGSVLEQARPSTSADSPQAGPPMTEDDVNAEPAAIL